MLRRGFRGLMRVLRRLSRWAWGAAVDPRVPVSRHGLAEQGVRCLRCGCLAVMPGHWDQVHQFEKSSTDSNGVTETWIEEGVCCWNCNAFLVASPDSDIDPVTFGAEYDPAQYHVFARPEGWAPPLPPISSAPPQVGDWVLILPGTRVDAESLGGNEGRVREVEGDTAIVALGTLPSQIARVVPLPLASIKVRMFDTYKEGVPVLVTRGPWQGVQGTVQEVLGDHALIAAPQLSEREPHIRVRMSHLKRIDHISTTEGVSNG